MLLKNKTALIYGAGGSLGSAIARAFADAGAHVVLTGRHIDPVQHLSKEIISTGGNAESAQVDALDEEAVGEHLKSIVEKGRNIDISFNAVGYEVKQDVPLVDLKVDQYVDPVTIALQTHFI